MKDFEDLLERELKLHVLGNLLNANPAMGVPGSIRKQALFRILEMGDLKCNPYELAFIEGFFSEMDVIQNMQLEKARAIPATKGKRSQHKPRAKGSTKKSSKASTCPMG